MRITNLIGLFCAAATALILGGCMTASVNETSVPMNKRLTSPGSAVRQFNDVQFNGVGSRIFEVPFLDRPADTEDLFSACLIGIFSPITWMRHYETYGTLYLYNDRIAYHRSDNGMGFEMSPVREVRLRMSQKILSFDGNTPWVQVAYGNDTVPKVAYFTMKMGVSDFVNKRIPTLELFNAMKEVYPGVTRPLSAPKSPESTAP